MTFDPLRDLYLRLEACSAQAHSLAGTLEEGSQHRLSVLSVGTDCTLVASIVNLRERGFSLRATVPEELIEQGAAIATIVGFVLRQEGYLGKGVYEAAQTLLQTWGDSVRVWINENREG